MASEDEFTIKVDINKGEVRTDLREFQRLCKETAPKPPLSSFSKMMRTHLGGRSDRATEYWPERRGKLMLHTFEGYLGQHYNLDNIEDPDLSATSHQPLQLGDGLENDLVLVEGYRLLIPKAGARKRARLVISHSVDSDSDIRITVHYLTDDETSKREAAELLVEMVDYAWANSVLRGRVFDMTFRTLNRDSRSVEDLTLNDEARKAVDFHIVRYIDSLPLLRKAGLTTNRGVILSGPPGTGKTLIVKDVIAKTSMTTIVITTAIKATHLISEAYRIARKLAPALVILEDIDAVGGISRQLCDHPILGEVLQALNGIESNEGVITLATTNFAESLDEALRDRPGRFDVVIRIDVPNSETRHLLLERLLCRYEVEEAIDLKPLVRQTKGLTGAWIDELVKTALQNAIISDGRSSIRQSDLTMAVKDIRVRRSEAHTATGLLCESALSPSSDVFSPEVF
jgi:AAA+ superfamily predicted ATPase